MYIFLFIFFLANLFIMSKMFVYLLEIFLINALIPLINWINGIHNNLYKLELRKTLIHENIIGINESDSENEYDNDSENESESKHYISEESSENSPKESNISSHYIDDKLD